MRECSRRPLKRAEKVGDSDGGGYALQAVDDEESQQAAGNRQRNQRIQQNPENKACMHRTSSRIHAKARLESTLPKDHEAHIA